eukprot:6244603-Alexandrium_andersonii.AAC.1
MAALDVQAVGSTWAKGVESMLFSCQWRADPQNGASWLQLLVWYELCFGPFCPGGGKQATQQ